jgi:hypothetical protein
MLTSFFFDPRWLLCRAGIALGGLCFAGCFTYPDSSERLNDDVVFTGHSKDADFSNFRTFAVDPIVHLANVGSDSQVQTTDAGRTLSDGVVSHLTQQLEDRGFQSVDAAADPDLGVSVTAISGSQSGVVTGGYWGGYYASYWGFPGYSYYYPYSTYYTYQTGSLIVDMADLSSGRQALMAASSEPDDAAPGGLAVVWGMIAYKAYVGDDDTSRVNAANAAIDQALEQSPYLERN